MQEMIRREFLKRGVAAMGGLAFVPLRSVAGDDVSTVYVVHGTDPGDMLKRGIEKMGGWGLYVRGGKTAVIKPNAAWPSLPAQGGNTHPELVRACVAGCKAAGASGVIVPEHACSDATRSFDMSGIKKAVTEAGGRMISATDREQYRSVTIPHGERLKTANVVKEVLDAGCLINMPVAKTHGSASLTLSMKNWMGSVYDRGVWHRNNLHQCIADFSTRIKPTLVVLDATRIMLTRGPRGPGQLAYPNEIVLGTDSVAVDAYAATLFDKKPFDILHIRLAHEMGVGCGDLARVNVMHIR